MWRCLTLPLEKKQEGDWEAINKSEIEVIGVDNYWSACSRGDYTSISNPATPDHARYTEAILKMENVI